MRRLRNSAGVAFALASGLVLSGCGGGSETGSGDTAQPAADAAPTAAAPVASSLPEGSMVDVAALEKDLQGLGCFACHAVNEQRVGPAYKAIADKYRGQQGAADGLTMKVIAGGGGVWGPVPMIAHPHLQVDQIKPLVERILLIE